jgi:hypothetical protein
MRRFNGARKRNLPGGKTQYCILSPSKPFLGLVQVQTCEITSQMNYALNLPQQCQTTRVAKNRNRQHHNQQRTMSFINPFGRHAMASSAQESFQRHSH